MTRLDLVELGPPTTHLLSVAEGRALAASGLVDTSPDPWLPEHWQVRAKAKVGVARVAVPSGEPVELRIAPKVPIRRLFFLLGYPQNPKGWREENVEVTEHAELLPALAYAFERQSDRALRQGLLQGYRHTEESALVVRGRILESEQIRRRFGRQIPIEVAFDEFTTDIPENQLLAAATERLLRLPGVAKDVRHRLLRLRARLADVTPLVRGHQLPKWNPSRLNVRYQPALYLAGIVLHGASVEHLEGTVTIEGFIFNTAALFEDFVTAALTTALAPFGGHAKVQATHYLDAADAVRLKPDLVWYTDSSVPLGVADAKYKAEKPAGYPDADLYQLLAYCTVLGLDTGHLVYAKGNEPRAEHTVRNAGVRIVQHALDLDQPPQRLLADVARIAAEMAGAATHASSTA
ncbi:conserved hypothetical protein [Catenulispora acidiphila DSM 44928]|uniref:McrBC 5-methylcytosine restriction system component-like protein n=1 Tax=Catenulispora acidiphila (strain DSM 44928 / JCM 14897 / NBRC 102108 / NRRL B-24433 / ID139908) TaxID=479433 RepID=C7Q3M6_CATAD|nr:McrBC 5-methylcytosine restriction system component [Catenulispora acidiphila]ACU75791.1 conserved hypothetical protein [Catenulispora acidiphila DSM 44928]